MTIKPARHASGHAIALAVAEENRRGWLEGDFLGLASKKTSLQKQVGDSGTLWIVVSRPRPGGGRLYSLQFRLDDCSTYDDPHPRPRFGRHVVRGSPDRSTIFPTNDAELLLFSLRFESNRPIPNQGSIGSRLRNSRRLSAGDVQLLEKYSDNVRRWAVFVSYQRKDESVARRIAESLDRNGVSVFRDIDALRGGDLWEEKLMETISGARSMIVVLGETTHESTMVHKEIVKAAEGGVKIIPVIAGGDLKDWCEVPEITSRHALCYSEGSWDVLVAQLTAATRAGIEMSSELAKRVELEA